MVKLKPADLRAKDKKISDLKDDLKNLRTEMASLVVAKVTGGAASKLGKIKQVRKNVARVLTAMNQKTRDMFRSQVKNEKFIPKQLRAKKTRAIRRALTPEQKGKKTLKEQKRTWNFPALKYAVKP